MNISIGEIMSGILYLLIGGFASYVVALIIYGFSVIVENTNYTITCQENCQSLNTERSSCYIFRRWIC